MIQLSDKVLEALNKGNKIEAITLLRRERSIGLKEAKEWVEAYDRKQNGASLSGTGPERDEAPGAVPQLPDDVARALARGKKIEAITLLRRAHGLGLSEAKAQVEEFQTHLQTANPGAGPESGHTRRFRAARLFVYSAVLASFVWAMVNMVDVASSVIVLIYRGGYDRARFTIEKLVYRNDHKGGLSWGFAGKLSGRGERFYAPSLADGKALGYRGLKERFPPGTNLEVWYNSKVTGTLFQHRTIRVIPYTPDLAGSEKSRLLWWVKFCLVPFAALLFLAGRISRRNQESGSTIPPASTL
ncbi:MAG: hypothetical protein CVU57_08500 [Deltaproteobacteria bacterium HGW-Deltaproteobacteria-15]|nr:MAG: hypothetical protein CVU57_08500 [Deltaproteobacteria bacterium HGW-Deltaproteobacteria-15]